MSPERRQEGHFYQAISESIFSELETDIQKTGFGVGLNASVLRKSARKLFG